MMPQKGQVRVNLLECGEEAAELYRFPLNQAVRFANLRTPSTNQL